MASIPFRSLGSSGINVSALGLGCMGMSFAYGPADEVESLRVLRRYIDLGGNFFDTAEVYGPYENEELLGRFLRQVPRESVVEATTSGIKLITDVRNVIDSSHEIVTQACHGSLTRFGIDQIDLPYHHQI